MKKEIAKLDEVFSKWIRQRDSDENGYAKCISCGEYDHWTDMDCGHYIDRKHMSTRFDEENCNAQCRVCNRLQDGNLEGYLKAIGTSLAEDLVRRKYQVQKYNTIDLRALIDKYKKQLK